MPEHPCPSFRLTPACVPSSKTKMEYHVPKIRAVWGTLFCLYFLPHHIFEMHFKSQMLTFIFILPVIALLLRLSRNRNLSLWWVVLALLMEHFALLLWRSMKTSFVDPAVEYMPGVKVSENVP